jgi:glycosyltransferase 2 family protein
VLAERGEHGPVVWLVGWEQGDVASSELARRMDVTALVALLALRVGARRALDSAVAVLPDDDIAAIGPLLQTVALPRETRDEMRAHKDVLADLRAALVARLPQAEVEPQQLIRFGARTVVTILMTTVAVFVVLATINVDQIAHALTTGDWRWIALAFALGLLTLFGAGLAVVALSPIKVTPWHATLMQTAATYLALAVPAGIGPAALHVRLLQRRGVSASLSAATAALVQVLQFVVTVLLLLVLSLVSGTHESLPISPLVLLIIAIVVVCLAATMLFPRVRTWVLVRVQPIINQTWPRLLEVLGQPLRLLLAVSGNLINTLGYVAAFWCCLAALGQGDQANLVQVSIIYLTGNTLGSIIPTPGGVGAVETALGATLASVAGINAGVAFSIAVLFRVVTYWLRIPLGWTAMRYLQRSGEL